jgi:uncharacterized protein (DUF1501 family)
MRTRREFLRNTLTGVAATYTLPSFLHNTALSMEQANIASGIQATTGRDHPILVVLQLGGGNDGLNTVIPLGHDAYYTARPGLGLKGDNVLKINDEFGLNASLSGIKDLYDSGDAALINGVGYPNPNRSHFRSMEIWQTASDSQKNEYYGWLGRYFDNQCTGTPEPAAGISIGNSPPQAFHGTKQIGIAMKNPKSYQFIDEHEPTMMGADAEDGSDMTGDSIAELNISAPVEDPATNLDFLKRTTMDAEVSSETVLNVTKTQQNAVEYPKTRLARDLSLVAQLIAGGMPTRVYYVSLGGFDTHANQTNTHNRLLKEFSDATAAFCKDLKKLGHFDRVMLMSFSEFGRRVKENASGGTDHGVAGPMFLFGGGVKAGNYGNYPSLTDLIKGDLKHNVDFRSVYATVLDKWMNVNSTEILKKKFPHLAFA